MKKLLFFTLNLFLITALFGQFEKTLPASAPSLPCQFSWATVVPFNGGNPENFTEDKGCQPYQGPCVAFSFVKTMEAKLNIKHSGACEVFDFSIPFLESMITGLVNLEHFVDRLLQLFISEKIQV